MSVDHALFRLSKALGRRKRPRDTEMIPFGPADEVRRRLVEAAALEGDPVTSVWTKEGPPAIERLAQQLREFAPLAAFDAGSGAFHDPLVADGAFPRVRNPGVSRSQATDRFDGLGRTLCRRRVGVTVGRAPGDALAMARRPDLHAPVPLCEQEIRGAGWSATPLVRVTSDVTTWERATFSHACTPLARLGDDELLLFAGDDDRGFHLERTRARDGVVLAQTGDVFEGGPNFVDIDTCGRRALVSYDCRFVALLEL